LSKAKHRKTRGELRCSSLILFDPSNYKNKNNTLNNNNSCNNNTLVWFRLMMFNATFNNISAISWQSVLLVEETGVPVIRSRNPKDSQYNDPRPKV
jgi:hypothetical protein